MKVHLRKRFAVLTVKMILVFWLTGCHTSKKEDKNVFCYNESSGISSLDPAFAKNQSNIWATHQIFNTLVETDQHTTIIPSLAIRWAVSPNKKEISFTLRNDIFFHDHPAFLNGKGRKMNASDVVYSFERLIDPKTASPGAWIFLNRIDTVKPFEAINDTVFVLRLNKPFVQIMGVLTNQYCSIVPKEVVEYKEKSFREYPCGTGPFVFFSWAEGEELILKKNPSYFEKDSVGHTLPYLDGIRVSFINNKATEFLEFRQGKFDFMNDIDPSFKDDILTKSGYLRKEWEGQLMMQTSPYLNTEYLGILQFPKTNSTAHPLGNKLVRKAISLSIDRKKLMLYLRNSIGIPAEKGFIPPVLFDRSTEALYGYSFDPAEAVLLLKKAGYNYRNPVPEIRLTTVSAYADLASFISRELKKVGIELRVEVIPKSLLLTQMANNRIEFFRGSWIADYPEAENFLSVFYSKNPSPPNYTKYMNSSFDQLYETVMQTEDKTLQKSLYRQMDSMVMEDAPVIPLWYDQVIHLVQPNIKDFEPNLLNILELRKVKKL